MYVIIQWITRLLLARVLHKYRGFQEPTNGLPCKVLSNKQSTFITWYLCAPPDMRPIMSVNSTHDNLQIQQGIQEANLPESDEQVLSLRNYCPICNIIYIHGVCISPLALLS